MENSTSEKKSNLELGKNASNMEQLPVDDHKTENLTKEKNSNLELSKNDSIKALLPVDNISTPKNINEGKKKSSQKKLSLSKNFTAKEQISTDKYHIVRITMYLFGISCLLPWNFFIQANDYWMYKFRNVTSSDSKERTELQATFPSYLAIASKVPYLLFLFVNTMIANRFKSITRMRVSLSVMIILFGLVVILVPVNTDNSQSAFFVTTICIIIALNVVCGFFQGAGTGIAGSLPREFMGYNVSGMAIGGVISSLAQIASLVGNTTAITSAFIYFISAMVILGLTFLLFHKSTKTDFYIYHMSKQVKSKQISFASDAMVSINVLKKISLYALSVTLIFWITLSILPAIFVLVVTTSKVKTMWTEKFFIPFAFLLFNVCDLGGRILANIQEIPLRYKYFTLLVTTLRVVFIPLFLLCNAQPRFRMPVLFYDGSFFTLIAFFALTNGYLANVILTQAPKQVEEKYQELAGSQMAFFLGLGLMLGSVTSYGLVKML